MTRARRPRGLGARSLVALARADFLERVRRGGFLVVIALAIWAAYVFLPPNHARYVTLQFDGHRGIYNSAWIGTLVAMQCTVFVGFAGFYLIKNAVARDRETGVGAVLATTPMSRIEYAIGKWLSNLAVLASMVAVVAVAAGVMQIARAEDPRIDPLVLLAPFVWLTLPAMSLLAALALVFEMVPWLRGGLGNVGFFFLWIAGLSSPLLNRTGVFDVVGLSTVIPAIERAVHAIHPGYVVGSRHFSMGFNFRFGDGSWDLVTFPWTGIEWTGAILAPRAGLVAVALGLTLGAALLFDRFDTATVPRRASRKSQRQVPAEAALTEAGASALRSPTLTFARLPAIGRIRPGFLGLTVAEVGLMVRGVGPWWKLAAAGLMVAGFVAPLAMARTGFVSAALIWPLTTWSALGHRESRHHTEGLVFSTPRPTFRVFLAQWVAGTLCAIAIGLGPLVRGVMTGDTLLVAAQFAGSMFVPALALACGAWSGSARLFEVIYVLVWYAGPLQRASFLDYTGMHGTTPSRVLAWGALAAGLLALTMVGRRLRSRG
jgi:hypothetical protein